MEEGGGIEKWTPWQHLLHPDPGERRRTPGASKPYLLLSSGLEPVEGGYTEAFVLPISEKHKCELCHLVLCQPKQTECGHRFCRTCLDTLLSFPSALCPADQNSLHCINAFNDVCCQREIIQLQVYCRNREVGCTEQLPLEALEKHLNNCPHQRVQCPHSACRESLPRCQLAEHLNASCPWREQKCSHCLQNVVVSQTQNHEETDCPSYPTHCPNHCGIAPVPRSQVTSHLVRCPLAENCCEFQKCGCTFKGTTDMLKEHQVESVHKHLVLLLRRDAALEEMRLKMQEQLHSYESLLQKLTARIEHQEKELSQFKQLAESSSTKLSLMQRSLAAESDRLLCLETENLWKSSTLEDLKKWQQEAWNKFDSLTYRLDALEAVRDASLYQGATNTALETQVGHQDLLLSRHDVCLADMDERLQLLETTSYDGKLVWKISDYSRRKQEAACGKTASLYSQPFYTSAAGYKMCARVYLNGDGIGKGTHLSAFFVLMKGEFDSLLPWPFQQKVTLSLLDQGPGKHHISNTFKPDEKSSSFKRPVCKMNVASGCPILVKQTVLENGLYVLEDTIFIKVTVDTTGLPEI
uniref:TNF receptor-associated factor n=1 Tax=Andrias davidianus TaxID=141262 RepID=A0A8E4NV64_ANDDA|nr:tumor necrosis factor receptor associated factor 3B [Andrias davidianus]